MTLPAPWRAGFSPATLRRELGLRDLALFNIAAVVSIRWLATAAHIGPGSLLLWIGAAALFFVPLALAVASLAQRFPDQGGIYVWTARSFGEGHGFACGWCYWTSNLFYFPNLLMAVTSTALYTSGPRYAALAENGLVVACGALAVMWIALLSNLFGLHIGKWTQNLGAIATCAAGAGLAAAGLAALMRHGPATRLETAGLSLGSLNFWPQIAFAFGGLELGAILGGEIRDPARTIRRAAWISALAIAVLYAAGTLSLLILVPAGGISIVGGLGQAAAAAARFSGVWAAPVLGALVVAGFAGQFGAWISGAARLAFVLGLDRYFPASFTRLHPRWGTPHVALLAQGIGCTVFLAALQSGETLRAGYQLLVDMTVIAYFVPFLYLFAAAWKHGRPWCGASGLSVTLAGIVFSFVPPPEAGSVWLFEAKLAGSCLALAASGYYLFARRS